MAAASVRFNLDIPAPPPPLDPDGEARVFGVLTRAAASRRLAMQIIAFGGSPSRLAVSPSRVSRSPRSSATWELSSSRRTAAFGIGLHTDGAQRERLLVRAYGAGAGV